MSTPSTIAAVTLAMRKIVADALPRNVEVSSLPPSVCVGEQKEQSGRPARVGVMLCRVTESAAIRRSPPGGETAKDRCLLALELYYLISFQSSASPDEEDSKERLLEAVYVAFHEEPVLSPAKLAAALPAGVPPARNCTGLISSYTLTLEAEMHLGFSALHAEGRPALLYLVRLIES